MKIGIPRALLYHKYHVMWEVFLRELGFSVITSKQTSKDLFDRGLKHCLDEICLPVKIFYGHVADLSGKVDLIFIPQVISIEKRESKFSFTCPKMIALPDMIKATFPDLKILRLRIDEQKRSRFWSYFLLGLKLSKNPFRSIRAYVKAKRAQESFEREEKEKLEKFRRSDLKIALLSHSYNLCETYPNVNIEWALEKLGAYPLKLEMLPRREILKKAEETFPELSWNYERELLGAAKYIIQNDLADGVIMVANFGCGPDSLVGDYILRLGKRESKIPFTMIITDEHTGEAGIMTRLEAFIDMIKFKSAREKKIKEKVR